MNFVVIMSDSLRPDYLRPYGNNWVHTPTAEAFAQSAALFEQAYCGSWATIPNRTDLFTGRFGEPIHPWQPLGYDEITLPRLLGENGYVTQLICDTPHLVQGGHNFDFPFHAWQFFRGQEVDRFGMDHDPLNLPFKDHTKVRTPFNNRGMCQYLRNSRGRMSEEDWTGYKTFSAAVKWLERNARQDKFFLWIDGFDPHEPPDPPQHYTDLYDPGYKGDVFMMHIRGERLTEAEMRHVKARYAGSVTFVDRQVGRVLQALDDLKLADDTCVVWMSDHGTHVGDHSMAMGKNIAFDTIARIVMMARLPKAAGNGKRFQQIVQPADLAPTLLELAGLKIPDRMQGRSFAAGLRGEPFEGRPVAITSNTRALQGPDDYPEFMIGARDGRWVLNDFPTPERRKLWDMQSDPDQLTNIAEAHPDECRRLRAHILEFLRTHDSPPQIVRYFENGDPKHMEGYKGPRRPGMEKFTTYFSHLYNSRALPEP